MTAIQSKAFNLLTEGVEQWVSLDGEYTDFEIVRSIPTREGQEGFFLINHKDSVEIIFAWNSIISSKMQVSVEFRSDSSPEQSEAATKIFQSFANRLGA